MTSQQQQRTDALTALADKYAMTAGDRVKLFKLYVEAIPIPPGWVLTPEEPAIEQLHAAMKEDPKHISTGRWNMMRDALADTYYRMIKARPKPPI